MNVRPIETDADHDWALAEVEQYFVHPPAPGSPEAARFSVLSTLIDAYEDKVWPIEAPDPIGALQEVLSWRGLDRDDLGRILGGSSAASALLDHKASLTIEQAWTLHKELGIPADILLRPAKLAAE